MTEANSPATLVGDREIAATRIFDAPRNLVFKMWTDRSTSRIGGARKVSRPRLSRWT